MNRAGQLWRYRSYGDNRVFLVVSSAAVDSHHMLWWSRDVVFGPQYGHGSWWVTETEIAGGTWEQLG